MNTTKEHKIIFTCNYHGVISEIFLDTAGIFQNLHLPIGIHNIVAQSSIDILGQFWLSIKKNSIEEDFLINLNNHEENIKYNFSGYLLDDKFLLCGKTEMNATQKAMVDIMLINNEQANKIRLTEKKSKYHPKKSKQKRNE